MKCTGRIQNIARDWKSGQLLITFAINEASAISEIDKIKDVEKLSIEAKKHREKRSLDANALLWACIGDIAKAMTPPADKWDVYLDMLKNYGKYTYICVKPNVVEAMKAQWRECEVLGEVDINGQKSVQMLCYFGSSTLNTKEFSDLLEGVIYEMEQVGLQPPPTKDMRRALEQWEQQKYGK